MKWQSVENKIKIALSGHRSEVDVNEIWAAIEPQVDAMNKRKKRRGFFLWFWLTGVVLAGGALAYFYQNETGRAGETLTETPVAMMKNESGRSAANSPVKEFQEEPSENTTAELPGENDALSATLKFSGKIAGTQPDLIEKTLSSPVLTRPQTAPAREFSLKDIGQSDFRNLEDFGNLNPGLNTSAAPIAEQKIQTFGLDELPVLPISSLTLPPTKLPGLTTKQENIAASLEETPPVRRNSLRFSAGVQGSISFVDRKLESDSFHLDLLDLRNKTERELEAIQAGLRLTVRHSSGLGLTSGVNYTQINERFRYNTSVTTLDSIYGIQYYVITINNDTVPYYGDVPVERKTTYKKEFYNKYRMVEIPVLADYRYEGRDFSVGLQAGVFANLSLTTSGRFLAAEDAFEDLSDTDIFKSNVGLSYYFGLSAGYLINENIELTISPFMRHFPKSFTESSYGLMQRYNLYGVNVGAVYHFD